MVAESDWLNSPEDSFNSEVCCICIQVISQGLHWVALGLHQPCNYLSEVGVNTLLTIFYWGTSLWRLCCRASIPLPKL